jgi:hypothetical protein
LSPAKGLETLRAPQHLTPLLSQRGELSGELLLPCHTDREDLCGFLPSRRTAEGRQAQRDASCILRLAHAVVLGHPEKRFDGIGADRQADVIQPQCRGGLKLEREIGVKLQT